MTRSRDWLQGAFVVALLMLAFAVKGALILPPALPTSVPSGGFDTQRAIGRLQRILNDQRPHPVDSVADDVLRERLIAELTSIGLQADVQDASDCSLDPRTPIVSCSRVRNIIATLPGRTNGPHLLLNAHYDSTPTGPGASDDGLGVATLLEVASILKGSPPPERPVTFLFNEGEEFGLNGSAAFVRSNEHFRQVNSLINIDTRGVTGPALMFETSEPNGPALSIYARGARRPYANSLSTDFAKLIPNTTDVVEFKHAGWTILNFAIVGNETLYHSPGDRVEALNRASLHHVGTEVLSLTRAMANTAIPAPRSTGEVVFTDIAGRAFIHVPLTFGATVLALLLLTALALAWRERALTRPLLLVAAMVIGGIAATCIIAALATLARPGDFWRAYPLVTYLAVYAVLLTSMLAFLWRWSGRTDRGRLRAAAWLFILLIGSALSLLLPGAVIFFLVAPAIALVGVALQRRAPGSALALLIGGSLIQFVMLAEILALVELLLIDGPIFAVAPLAALAVLPLLIEIPALVLRPAVILLAAGSTALWISALALPRSSAERPASFSIDYFRDADDAKAFWAVASKQAPLPAGYPYKWHEGTLAYNGRRRWIANASLISTPLPSARLIAAQPSGAGRRVRIALSSGGADALSLRFAKGNLLEAGVPGAVVKLPTAAARQRAIIRCSGRSCDDFEIEAVLSDRAPVDAELFSFRFTLPAEGKILQSARPVEAISQYAPDSAITMTKVKL